MLFFCFCFITVPSEWATFSASSPDFSPLYNHTYTLVCEVTPVPGMNLPITVNWILPNGDLVTEEDGTISSGTMKTDYFVTSALSPSCNVAPRYLFKAELPIIFNPIVSSNGGHYSCRAVVKIPWQGNQTSQLTRNIPIIVTSELKVGIMYNVLSKPCVLL